MSNIFIVKKNEVHSVKVIKTNSIESEVELVSGTRLLVDNTNLYTSKGEAKLARNEIIISKKFKKRYSNKKGIMACEKCGHKGKDLTLDHIIPLAAFGGRYKIRQDIEMWKDAWDESNLQILCEDCNKAKGKLSQKQFDKVYLKGMILSNKKNKLMSHEGGKECHKAGFGVATGRHSATYLDDFALIKIAKMDSRNLYPELILG